MFPNRMKRWLEKMFRIGAPTPSSRRQRCRRASRRRFVPQLEALDMRWLPSIVVVNTTADNVNDANISGPTVTLREAINYENANGGGTITFASSAFSTPQTITLSLGALDVTSNVAITGPAAALTISGNSASGVLAVGDGTDSISATITDLTLSSGNTASNGGGVLNNAQSTLTLFGCLIINDTTSADGGGVANFGTLTLTNDTLTGDTGTTLGGGLYNAATATITNCTFTNDSSNSGGAMLNASTGTLTMDNTSIEHGSASSQGGGIDNNGTLTLSNATLSDNSATYAGGGIDNNGTLALSNATLAGNSASNGSGGGISNNGTLTLSNSTLSGNSASYGGGIGNNGTLTLSNATLAGNSAFSGGGIINGGTLTLSNTTVAGNSANSGGGIANGGTLTLSNATVAGNSANSGGGGIYSYGALTLSNATVAGNSANFGGGIRNDGGTMTLSSSTLAGNSASNGSGGGILNGGTLTLSNSTLAGNSASYSGGGIANDGTLTLSNATLAGNSGSYGGGIVNYGMLTLQNTIVAQNTAPTAPDIGQLQGSISAAYSLIGNGSGSGIANGGTNIIGNEPTLGALADNGGPTETIAQTTGAGIGTGGAVTTVGSGGFNTSTTTIPVADAQAIASTPGDYLIEIDGEDMLVTNVNLTNNTLTVIRGYNGTSETAGDSGDGVFLLLDQRGDAYAATPDIGAYQSTGTAPATPFVTGVSASSGPLAGGAVVTITGINLANATLVDFGGLPGTILSDSGTQIVAITPAESAGTVDTTVTTVGWDISAASAADLYSFEPAPSVSVTDNSGTYTGSAFAASASVMGVSGGAGSTLEGVGLTLTYYSGTYTLSNLPSSGGSSSAPITAGSYTVVASFAGSTDYSSASALANFTIGQAVLTVTATGSQTYGGANQTFTPSYNGFVNGDGPSVVSGTPLFSTTATASSPVSGSYTASVTVSALLAANYTFVAGTPGTFTVNTAVLTATATGSQTYGGTNQRFTPSYSGFVNGDGPGVVGGTPLFSTTATASSPVSGSYTASVKVSGLSAANYTFVAGALGTFTVNPAPLTISADSNTKVYGQANPSFTASDSGFVNGNSASSLTGTLSLATSATSGSAAGTYAITPSGVSSANYSITFVSGTLFVTSAPLTISADSTTKVYGQANPSFSASDSGFVNGDSANSLTGTLSLATSATTGSAAGTYAITPSGVSSGNYSITFVNGTLTVTPAADTITFPPIPVVPLGVRPFTLNATGGGSTSPVVYTVLFGPGSVNGSTLTVTALGSVLIEASQAGDANYTAAAPVFRTVQVEKPQTIKFTPPTSPVSFGVKPITLSASASSALPVTFRVISGPGTITVNKGLVNLTVTGAGSIVIEADQAGNSTYAAATAVERTIVVNPANQTITFNQPAAVTYGVGTVKLSATASSAAQSASPSSAAPARGPSAATRSPSPAPARSSSRPASRATPTTTPPRR